MRLSCLVFALCCSITAVFASGCDPGDDADTRFLEAKGTGAEDCKLPGDEDGDGLADCDDPICKDLGLCGDGEPTEPGPCSDPVTKEDPGCGDGSPTGECKLDGDGKPDCSDPACIDLCKG